MFGKSVALIQVPNKRLFKIQSAARYLDISVNTLRKYSDLGLIKAKVLAGEGTRPQRIFELEELERFCSSLPDYNKSGEKPSAPQKKGDE